MNSQSESLGNFDEFIVKAFVIALYKFDQSLSPELNTKINTVAQAWQLGDVGKVKEFIAIAQKNPDFEETFNTAYDELTKLDESKERNKYLSIIEDKLSSRPPEDDPNQLASILEDSNPQSASKKFLAGVDNIVEWIFKQRI